MDDLAPLLDLSCCKELGCQRGISDPSLAEVSFPAISCSGHASVTDTNLLNGDASVAGEVSSSRQSSAFHHTLLCCIQQRAVSSGTHISCVDTQVPVGAIQAILQVNRLQNITPFKQLVNISFTRSLIQSILPGESQMSLMRKVQEVCQGQTIFKGSLSACRFRALCHRC